MLKNILYLSSSHKKKCHIQDIRSVLRKFPRKFMQKFHIRKGDVKRWSSYRVSLSVLQTDTIVFKFAAMALNQAEQGVLDRRLKPIYEALDADTPSTALKIANDLLKKHKLVVVHILKALALLRLERVDEAIEILNKYEIEKLDYDDNTFQALIHCFKEAQLPDKICAVYARAVKTNPTEKNLINLALQYLRMQNYISHKSSTQRLWIDFQKTDYFYWYMIALVLEAHAHSNLATLDLQLANQCIRNFIGKKNRGYREAFELEMHLTILEELGQRNQIWEVLNANKNLIKDSKPIVFVNQYLLDMNVNALMWENAVRYCKKMIDKLPDDWKAWKTWIDIVIALKQDSNYPAEITQRLLNQLLDLLDKMSNDNVNFRGPYMARLLFMSNLKKNNLIDDELSKRLGDAGFHLSNFICKFHKKPCCYVDIAAYLPMIENTAEWFGNIKQMLKNLYDQYKEDSKTGDWVELSSKLIALEEKICLNLGLSTNSTDEKEKMLTKLANTIEETIIFNNCEDNKDKASDQASGELAFLCMYRNWKDWAEKEDHWESVVEGCLFAEYAMNEMKEEYYTKLALLRFYNHIGDVSRCNHIYKRLDIKSVQQDTLGYYFFNISLQCGRITEALENCRQLAAYFTTAEKDVSESLTGAVTNRAFTQIPGIIELLTRVEKSTMSAANDVNSRYLSSLFTSMDKARLLSVLEGDRDLIDWNGLSDNRDLSLLPLYEQTAWDREQDKIDSQREFVDITQLKHYICRAIGAIGLKEKYNEEKLRNEVVLLKAHLDHCRTSYLDGEPCRIMQAAPSLRLGEWVHGKNFDPIIRLLNSTVEIAITQKENAELTMELLPSKDELSKLLDEIIPSFDSTKGYFYVHDDLFKASRCLQTLGTCYLILQMLDLRIETPAWVSTHKKSAGKGKVPPIVALIQDLRAALLEAIKKLGVNLVNGISHIEAFRAKLVPPLATTHDQVVYDLLSRNYDRFSKDLRVSYMVSIKGILEIIQDHFKILLTNA